MSSLGPLQSTGEVNSSGEIEAQRKLFRLYFGPDTALLETKVVQHLKSLPYRDPFAEWPHWVGMIELSDGRRDANLFHSPLMADKWVTEQLAALPARQSAGSRKSTREFSNRAKAEEYAQLFMKRRTVEDQRRK